MFDSDESFTELEILEKQYSNDNPELDKEDTSKKKKKKLKYKNISGVLKGNRHEFESVLLDCVFERPPLFDYTIPIKQRTPGVLNKLWEDVLMEMRLKFEILEFDVNLLKEVYKNLRNQYTRYKNSLDKIQSGSCLKILPEPKHINKLRRLDRVLVKRAHKSSLDLMEKSVDSFNSAITSPTPTEPAKRSHSISTCSVTPSKTTNVTDFLEPLNRLVDNVTNRPMVPDMEQLFGDQVAIFLRGLSTTEMYTSQLYIMTHMQDVMREKEINENK